jgi:hypothetical protein
MENKDTTVLWLHTHFDIGWRVKVCKGVKNVSIWSVSHRRNNLRLSDSCSSTVLALD